MAKKYESWFDPTDNSVSLSEVPRTPGKRKGESRKSKLLYAFEASTFEEALSIHFLRMGFGPYKPIGEPKECPKCQSYFYPEGSGECWKCNDWVIKKKSKTIKKTASGTEKLKRSRN